MNTLQHPIALDQMPQLDVVQPTWTTAELQMLEGKTALDLGQTALDAMMEQQLVFQDLSLDNPDTQTKLATEEGQNALAAANLNVSTMTKLATPLDIVPEAAAIMHHNDMVHHLFKEDEKNAKAKKKRDDFALAA